MTEWIIPCNPKLYKVDEAFENLKIVDWRRTNNTKNIEDGDIVYIYVSTPVSQIAYKGAVLKAFKPNCTIDDSAYSIPPGQISDGECMEIALFRAYEMDGLDINTLKENGLTSNLQCAVRVTPQLANYLHYCDNIQRNVDRFMGDIPNVCLVPFPISIKEPGIDKNIPLSPAEIDKDDKTITCRNCNEKFIKAKRCTFCGQLIAYKDKNSEENTQDDFDVNGINNAKDLYNYLVESGLEEISATSLNPGDNVIKLPNYITFNWKPQNKQVRVNCKLDEMDWIEAMTGYRHIDNGKGDPTHPYSFLLNSFTELSDVIDAIKRQ